METLNNAVRAAGFAMAACDEPHGKSMEAGPADAQWRPGEAILAHEPARLGLRVGEWIRGVLGLLGGRAPASSA